MRKGVFVLLILLAACVTLPALDVKAEFSIVFDKESVEMETKTIKVYGYGYGEGPRMMMSRTKAMAAAQNMIAVLAEESKFIFIQKDNQLGFKMMTDAVLQGVTVEETIMVGGSDVFVINSAEMEVKRPVSGTFETVSLHESSNSSGQYGLRIDEIVNKMFLQAIKEAVEKRGLSENEITGGIFLTDLTVSFD